MLPFAAKNGTLEKHYMQCKEQKMEASLHASSLSHCKGIPACQNVRTRLMEIVVHKGQQGLQDIHC